MTTRKYIADPGIGRDDAPIGSEPWAQAVRLHLQAIIKRLHQDPEGVKSYYDIISKHRAWTLMNKPDGSYFATWEEFCAHRQPWGLGKPWEEIRPFLEAAFGKRGVELATVAPDARRNNGATQSRDGNGQLLPSEPDSGHRVPNRKTVADEKHEKRLRAILRAPEPIQDAYRAGVIGQVDAAKLGPRDPEPEQAARIVEVARAVAPKIDAAKSLPKRDREKAKRAINATVREMLDAKPRAKGSTFSPRSYEDVWTAITRLPRDEQRTIHQRLTRLLERDAEAR